MDITECFTVSNIVVNTHDLGENFLTTKNSRAKCTRTSTTSIYMKPVPLGILIYWVNLVMCQSYSFKLYLLGKLAYILGGPIVLVLLLILIVIWDTNIRVPQKPRRRHFRSFLCTKVGSLGLILFTSALGFSEIRFLEPKVIL